MGTEREGAVKIDRAFDSTLESVDEAEALILETAATAGCATWPACMSTMR